MTYDNISTGNMTFKLSKMSFAAKKTMNYVIIQQNDRLFLNAISYDMTI